MSDLPALVLLGRHSTALQPSLDLFVPKTNQAGPYAKVRNLSARHQRIQRAHRQAEPLSELLICEQVLLAIPLVHFSALHKVLLALQSFSPISAFYATANPQRYLQSKLGSLAAGLVPE